MRISKKREMLPFLDGHGLVSSREVSLREAWEILSYTGRR